MFLVVEIDGGGYIRTCGATSNVIHRESRNAHVKYITNPTLEDAKLKAVCNDQAILELTEEGGGAAIWMRDDQRELLEPRLKIWSGCYGQWPVRRLK